MLQKMTRTSEKGFTLIELMIVIAIIGILAAIAIPNFISYRNKSYCSGAESDANTVAAMIANWAAIPTNTSLPTIANLGLTTMTNGNVPTIASADGSTNSTITITVTDTSGRCPADYQAALPAATNPMSFWDGAGVYSKLMSP